MMTTTDDQRSTANDMTTTAKQETGAVAQSAADAGKEVASAVSERTAAVADTAKQQLTTIVNQAKGEFRTQAESQGHQAIGGLRTLSDQVSALASGRPEEAGQLAGFLDDAQRRLQGYVSSLDMRGPQGMVDDVTRFARRRPGMFLLGAGVAGFAIGRMVRSASSDDDGQDGYSYGDQQWGQPTITDRSEMYSASGVRPTTSMSTSGYAPAASDMPLSDMPLSEGSTGLVEP